MLGAEFREKNPARYPDLMDTMVPQIFRPLTATIRAAEVEDVSFFSIQHVDSPQLKIIPRIPLLASVGDDNTLLFAYCKTGCTQLKRGFKIRNKW